MKNEILTIRGVSRRYPGTKTEAVHPLDFSLQNSQIVAITGESGCGKTTTLRMIAGFEVPDSGSIYLSGRLISGPRVGDWLPPEHRHIGMVFQDHALFPHLDVRSNIAFGLPRRGKDSPGKQRIDSLLELTGLEDLRYRYPYQLSGGQQQRVALARAMAPSPELLLMDEAFNNLDVRLKQRLLPDIRRLLKEAEIPTLIVTHDRYEAFELADRIVVMRDGRIIQDGSPQDIYEEPAHEYVADFFGEINFVMLEGRRYAIRPENLMVSTPLEGTPKGRDDKADDLAFHGVIQDLRYRGQFHELYVKIQDSRSPLDGVMLLAHSHGTTGFSPGKDVVVRVPGTALIRL